MTVAAPRRTQQERRTATRAALLDAAASSLTDLGFAGTTTTIVAERAGVSQGALFKHFPSKAALLAATGEHLYDGLTVRYVDRFHRLGHELDLAGRIDTSVRLLWQMFVSPEYAAAVELLTASRTDHDLRAALGDVVANHAARVRAAASDLFPEISASTDFADLLDLVLETMVGMAVSRIADRDLRHYERLVDQLIDLATATLTGARPTARANPSPGKGTP